MVQGRYAGDAAGCKTFMKLLQAGWAQLDQATTGNYRQHAMPARLRTVHCASRPKGSHWPSWDVSN